MNLRVYVAVKREVIVDYFSQWACPFSQNKQAKFHLGKGSNMSSVLFPLKRFKDKVSKSILAVEVGNDQLFSWSSRFLRGTITGGGYN